MLSRRILSRATAAPKPATVRIPSSITRTPFIQRPFPLPVPRMTPFPARRPFSTNPRLRDSKDKPRTVKGVIVGRGGPQRGYNYHPLHDARPLVTADSARAFFRRGGTRIALYILAAGGAYIIYNGIETVPVSGRRRLNIFPRSWAEAQGEREAQMMLNELSGPNGPGILPEWDPRVKAVKRAMARLLKAAGLDEEDGKEARITQQEAVWGVSPERERQQIQTADISRRWRVHVIDDPRTANAFVLPGGAVFVFSGILGIAGGEDGLAAVLGHEIAHNIAAHASEQMTQGLGVNALLIGLMAATAWVDGGYLAAWLGRSALGLVFQRPMSRRQESEADYIGLMMMAGACYDPREAVRFWRRMDERERASGHDVPEWLSTHPSNRNRMESLAKWLPEAEEKWRSSDCQRTQGYAEDFRKAIRFVPINPFGSF